MSVRRLAALVMFAGLLWPESTVAQPIGTFRWQEQPYCNALSLYVTQQGGQYTLHGTDDQCGASPAGVVGLAFLNPNGTIGFALTIVTTPGATPVHIEANIHLSSLNGTWSDSSGNSGSFVFTPGPGVGGAPRPIPSGGIAPGTITAVQLAPDSVTTTNIVNGSITSADLLDAPRATFAGGAQQVALTGSTPLVVRSVSVTAPRAGVVLANASASFINAPGNSVADVGRCSITTGTTLEFDHRVVFAEESLNTVWYSPIALTRGFEVPAGSTTTFNLVCDEYSGNVEILNSSLTALFVAQP